MPFWPQISPAENHTLRGLTNIAYFLIKITIQEINGLRFFIAYTTKNGALAIGGKASDNIRRFRAPYISRNLLFLIINFFISILGR